MEKVLISLPDDLARRMRALIPSRQRSKVISDLLKKEIIKREKELYECALAVDADKDLNNEMSEWDSTVADGIDDDTW